MSTLRNSRHLADRRRGNLAENEWSQFQRPALERMLIAGLSLASAMEDVRASLMWADDLTSHDMSAVDTIGGLLDHLSDAVGSARKRLDDLGVPVEFVELDTTELELAHQKLKRRADARMPNQQGPALMDALRDSLHAKLEGK